MNSPTRFPHPIELLMTEADILAKIHQIPTEAVLVHALAMASAMAGHLVTFLPTGTDQQTPVKIPLVMVTPDTSTPGWIGDQWQALKQIRDASDSSDELFRSPAAIAEQRRMNRTMDLLDPYRNHGGNWLAEKLARQTDRKSFGHVITSKHRVPASMKDQRPVTQLAGGQREFRSLLRVLTKDPGTTATPPQNHIAWLGLRELRTLAREEGPAVLSKLGTVVGCTAAIQPADDEIREQQMAALILKILAMAKFENRRFKFQPGTQVTESLDAEAAKTRAMLDGVPACLKDILLPEPRLAWHFAALLAAMCAGQSDENSDLPAAVVGTMLASWAARSHVHHIRQAFPADEDGFFEGRDLTIYRLLGQLPIPVRRIQRSRRGENKAECLQSLHRAVNAGLAVETSPGHFATTPGPKVDLSDFGSDQSAK
jgi:hypothetical protein